MSDRTVKCYGFFGSLNVAYFAADDKTGVHVDDWTPEQEKAVLEYATNHDDKWVLDWAHEMIANRTPKAPSKPKTTHRTINTGDLPAVIAAMQGQVRFAIQKETENTVSVIVLAEDSEALTSAIDSLYSYESEESVEDLQLAGDDEEGWTDALYGLFQAGRE